MSDSYPWNITLGVISWWNMLIWERKNNRHLSSLCMTSERIKQESQSCIQFGAKCFTHGIWPWSIYPSERMRKGSQLGSTWENTSIPAPTQLHVGACGVWIMATQAVSGEKPRFCLEISKQLFILKECQLFTLQTQPDRNSCRPLAPLNHDSDKIIKSSKTKI